jgi:hypothetical protein
MARGHGTGLRRWDLCLLGTGRCTGSREPRTRSEAARHRPCSPRRSRGPRRRPRTHVGSRASRRLPRWRLRPAPAVVSQRWSRGRVPAAPSGTGGRARASPARAAAGSCDGTCAPGMASPLVEDATRTRAGQTGRRVPASRTRGQRRGEKWKKRTDAHDQPRNKEKKEKTRAARRWLLNIYIYKHSTFKAHQAH